MKLLVPIFLIFSLCFHGLLQSMELEINELAIDTKEACYIGPVITLLNDLNTKVDQCIQDQNSCCETSQANCQETITTITTCCANLNVSFESTFTSINAIVTGACDLTGIFTTLTDNEDSLTNCCAEIQKDLNGVFTSLNHVESSLSTCCALISSDFNSTWTLMHEEFNQIISMLSTLSSGNSCGATSVLMPSIITAPGSYCLAKTMTGLIVISADDVVLDLNGQTLFNGQIIIQGRKNCIVQNGILDNSLTGSAALIITNCSNIIIDEVVIINPNDGIICNQATNVIVKNIIISGAHKNGINIIGTMTALHLQNFDIINTSSFAIYSSANIQDLTVQNGHIKFSNGIRVETSTVISNVKYNNVVIENTANTLFPITFLGISNNVHFSKVHIADAGQGMQFSTISQSLFEKCLVENIMSPPSSASSAYRIDSGNNIQFDGCLIFTMSASGTSTLDGFRMANATNLVLKNCTVEGITGASGVVNGFNISSCQRVTIQNCVVENISSATQADGLHFQTTNNALVKDSVVNGCNSNGYFCNAGTNVTYINCSASSCIGDGFRSSVTTNVVYEYCYSNNTSGAGFNVNNALCGNCESTRTTGFGFNGNSNSTAYNCFASFNTAGAYSAITGAVQALGAGSPKVGSNISA